MVKTQIKTLSLLYHVKEDRMILLLNKDNADENIYWITRRFYFSILFEFDTFLDRLATEEETTILEKPLTGKSQASTMNNSSTKGAITNDKVQLEAIEEAGHLLEHVQINLLQDKQNVALAFKGNKSMSESVMTRADFVSFYHLMKKSFPIREWGMI